MVAAKGVLVQQTSKRQAKDFTEDEKAAIVDECTVELYSPTLLAEKYNIDYHEIRRWVKEAGKFLPQKYMYNATGAKQLTKQPYLRTLSSDQPMLDSTEKENFENDIPLLAIHSVRKDGDMIKLNSPGLSTNSLNPTLVATGGVSVPQTRKRWARDFTEDEKAAIVDECTVELYSPTLLAEKYNIEVLTIRQWVKAAGKFLPWKYRYNATTQLTKQPDLRTLSSDLSIGN